MKSNKNRRLNRKISFNILTVHKRSLRQGNVFTPVCHSVHGGGGSALLHAGIHPPWADTPPPRILWDMVNKQAVRILLACILVMRNAT